MEENRKMRKKQMEAREGQEPLVESRNVLPVEEPAPAPAVVPVPQPAPVPEPVYQPAPAPVVVPARQQPEEDFV